MAYQVNPDPSYWNEPDTACMPCRGQGWIIQENDQGAPGTWVQCPYCHGTGTSWWVAPKREQRLSRFTTRRKVIAGLAGALLLTGNLWPPAADSTWTAYLFILHVVLWIALAFAWAASPPRRQVDPQHPKYRHAPGFTTNRERTALGLFGGFLGVRSMFDHHDHQQPPQPPQPPQESLQDYPPNWPAGPQVRYPTAGDSLVWNRYQQRGY